MNSIVLNKGKIVTVIYRGTNYLAKWLSKVSFNDFLLSV